MEVQKALQTDGLVVDEIEEDGTIIGEFTDNTGDTVEIISDIPATDEDRTALLKQATPLNINLVEVVKKELKIDFDKMSKTQAKEIEEYIDTKLEEKM